MKQLEFAEFANWCEVSGYDLRDWKPVLRNCNHRVKLAIPCDPQSLTDLVDALVTLSSSSTTLVVWIADWTMWNDRSQEIGLCHIKLLAEHASPSLRDDSHIYLLEPSEWR